MSESLRILIADDELGQRTILADILGGEGHTTATAGSGDEAWRMLQSARFNLLLTDLRMPGLDGVQLLKRAVELQPEISVILMTAYATVDSAVEAMKSGAYDYLQKPFGKAELLQRVERVRERVALRRENHRLREEVRRRGAPKLLGQSAAMQELLRQLERLAPAPSDVLITGESGTGKELIARALHERGPRREGPFVAVNCAAIPEGLAESELFGHEKGAFTGAEAPRAGRFEQADGGTLFLDEIGAMPLALQAKLLRVVQDRLVERVGGTAARPVEFRLVSATNRPLPDLVREKAFREDLYHRLNVLEVVAPPLRARREDIPLLADAFRDEAAARLGVAAPAFGAGVVSALERYPFPGNVRELKHLMERLVALAEAGEITVDSLPEAVRTYVPKPGSEPGAKVEPESLLDDGGISLPEVEERLLREAIRQSGGNLSEAARRLGISYKTLRYRAGKLGLG